MMVMLKKTVRVLLLLILFLGFGASADAGEVLTIKDSSGFVRGESSISESGKVEFEVTTENGAPATGSEVSLVNVSTGESFTTYAADGKAIFDAVPAGVYTVSSPDLGLTFTTVTISEGSAALGGTLAGGGLLGGSGGTVAVGALGAAAVAGGAIAISENSNGSSPMSQSE